VLAIAGTMVSAVAVYRSVKREKRTARDQILKRKSAATPP
jgi:hypothetical protein